MDHSDKGPPRRPEQGRRLFPGHRYAGLGLLSVITAAVILGIAAALPGATTTVSAQVPDYICHRTNSASNPYVTNDPADIGQAMGHAQEHQGPIASSPAVAQQLKSAGTEWGDIIPPIPDLLPNGLNWTTQGIAIHSAGCEVTTTTATLTIQKECIGTDDGSDFSITVSEGGTLIDTVVLGCGASDTVTGLVVGVEYIVDENPPSGWTGPNIRGLCDGDGTFIMAAGGGTCVVQNVAEEQTATLIVTKECIGTDDGTDFTINVSGGIGSAILGCGESDQFEVDAGVEYTVSETPPAGWDGPNIRGACDGDGTVTLAANTTGTCVVQNVAEEATATLFIEKECIGTDDGTDFTINVSGGIGSVVLGCGETSDPITVDAETVYTVSETPPAGWTGPNIRGLCDGDGTFSLEADDEGTCVVQNVAEEATATLFIEKECIGTDDGTDFTINVSGGIGSVVLGCGETSDPITVDAETVYTVSETSPDGWDGPNIRGACDGDGTVTLDPDETSTCVVQNVAEQLASVSASKACNPGADPAASFTFTLYDASDDSVVDTAIVGCGDIASFEGLEDGDFYVLESAVVGFTQDASNCGTAGSPMVVDPDEDQSCTITNIEVDGAPPASVVETPPTIVIVEVPQPPAAPVEATATPVAQVLGVTQVITPPNTGDGGLVQSEQSRGFMTPLLLLAGASGLVTALSVARLRHLKRR